jgi:phosphoribosylformimino-5-aminoimidazole carboxamide ribotide isomerase
MSDVRVIPAIDLKGGQCVRLCQGRADEVTVYGADPVAMARHWVQEGATYLHVVDLDGAFEGRPVHHELIARIVKAIDIPVQTGGGIRTDEDLRTVLDTGVDRAIMGTRALADAEGLARAINEHGARVAVGIDAREGRVQVKGWTETTDRSAVDLACEAERLGARTIIYTDTATDGMLQGTNVAAMDELCRAVECQVVASGGVTSAADMRRLRELGHENLIGAIVGKALYEGRVTLRDLATTDHAGGDVDED